MKSAVKIFHSRGLYYKTYRETILDYYDMGTITAVKSFIVQSLDVDFTNLYPS
jgi:hypothetical protein